MSSPTIPFSGLLDALRAKGLPVGVREYVAFGELWTRMDGATVLELRVAAGALLGSSPEAVRLVAETFDDLYGAREVLPLAPPPPPPLPRWRRWLERLRRSVLVRWTASVALVALAALALWVWSQWQTALPAMPSVPPYLWSPDWKPLASGTPALDPGATDATIPPEPSLPSPPVTFRRPAALATLGLTGVGTLLLWQWPRVRAAERRRVERAWRKAQASMSGPSTFVLAPLDPPTWFDRRDLEDAATLLGRAFTTGFASPRLDPTRTVHSTLTRGGVPTFVYELSTAAGTLLLLEDIAPEMAVWRSKVNALLAALRRQGVRIERWVFDGTPTLVGRDELAERVPLDHVARRVTASGVLVISSGSGLAHASPNDGPDWREALTQFRRRAWLNPVASRSAWRPQLRDLPLNVWPLTGAGVLGASADLAVDPEGRRQRPSSVDAATGAVLADDIERLKRLIAVAGQPSLDLVEVLRQRFTPDVPEDTVLHVLREAEHAAPYAVRLPPAEMQRLLAAERRENPARERAVREYVLGLLALQPAPAGSVAELRWRLAEAGQRAALAELGVGDASTPRATFRELASSPIWEEVHETAQGLSDVVPAETFGVTRIGELGRATASTGLPGALVTSGGGRSWLFPRPLELAIAALTALAVTGGLRAAGTFTGDAIPHVEGVYRLAFADTAAGGNVAGVLTASRNTTAPATAPATVQLFRDGQRFGEVLDLSGGVVERPVNTADTGHLYQVRAVLPQGNLALSAVVWVPPPRQTLTLSVDAMPWATVRVLNAQSEPVSESAYTTPTVLNLAVGAYRLEFSHPEYGTTTRDVTVEPGSDPQVRVVMPGFDAGAVARELMGASPARAQ